MIKLKNISYSSEGKQIIKPLSINLPAGKIIAVIGPNGAGKSTLLKLISGLVKPDSGEVFVDEKPVFSMTRKKISKLISLLPQRSSIPLGISVEDLVSCGRYTYSSSFKKNSSQDIAAIEQAMKRTGVEKYRKKVVDNLSGGEMQRVWLAVVLAQKTPCLLLDEPTSWLDIAHQFQVMEIIKKLNKEEKTTIIWVLHDLNQAALYSDEIIVMDKGKLIEQGAPELIYNKEMLKKVFKVDTESLFLSTSGQEMLIPVAREDFHD